MQEYLEDQDQVDLQQFASVVWPNIKGIYKSTAVAEEPQEQVPTDSAPTDSPPSTDVSMHLAWSGKIRPILKLVFGLSIFPLRCTQMGVTVFAEC